jgi:hypothetical protein
VTFGIASNGEKFGTPGSLVEPGTFVSVALASDEGGVVWHSSGGGAGHNNRKDVVREVRPLVVINPVAITGPDETVDEDPALEIANCLKRLAEREGADANNGSYRGRVAARLSEAFRSAVTPPRPPEPQGLGAVVEDAEGRKWLRLGDDDDLRRPWALEGNVGGYMADWRQWDRIAAVKVLSDGVPQ